MALNCTRCKRSGGKNGKNLRNGLCGDCSASFDKKTRQAIISSNKSKSKSKK